MGFRGMSPKQVARMMKRLGIEQNEVSGVREVIIRFADKEWVLSNVQVSVIRQGGVESFQVIGNKTERAIQGQTVAGAPTAAPVEIKIPMEDAALVASQTGVSIEVAMDALKSTKGDLAAAILKLRRA